MAVLDSVYTLIDWAKEHDQDGKPVRVVRMLAKRMPILKEMLWKEANMIDGHKTTIETGLPEAIWRVLGRGTPSSKGTVAEVKFKTAQASTQSTIDKDLAELGGNPGEARMQRADRFMEAITQKVNERLIYGANNYEGFPGLTHYYAALTGSNASDNVISCDGSAGDQTSAFLCNWGEGRGFGIYPKGLAAGVDHLDLGKGSWALATDEDGNQYPAYMDEWRFNCGLAIEDWREFVRVCNIDVSDLEAATSGYHEKLLRKMTKAHYRLPNGPGPQAQWMVPRFLAEHLHNAAVARTSATLTLKNFGGEEIPAFIGVPIRVNDGILVTESVVS